MGRGANNTYDSYDMWKENGQLEEVLNFVRTSINHFVSKTEIAKALHLSKTAVNNLRNKHKDFDDAFTGPKLQLKNELCDAMLKLALGYEEVTETQDITDGGRNGEQKRKVNRVKKQIGPNYKAIIYLLTKHFGKEYSEKYEELKIMERRLDNQKEEWVNEPSTSNTDETNGSDSLRE